MASAYGKGGYGVGAYGTSTPVALAAHGGSSGSGAVRFVVSPVFHPRASGGAFSGLERGNVELDADFLPAGFPGFGRGRAVIAPVFHPRPSPGVFGGHSYGLLQGLEFEGLPSPWTGGGRARAVLLFHAPFRRSGAAWGGHSGPFGLSAIWHRPKAAGARWGGHYAGQIWPQGHVRGGAMFRGVASGRMLFKAPFLPGRAAFSGHVHVSYTWSNLNAPGRTPAPSWTAIPAASTPDPWSLVPPAESGRIGAE